MISRLKTSFLLRFAPLVLIKKLDNHIAKRLFFLKQYEGTLKRIWGNEFAVESLKEARELVRCEYDKLTETLDATKIALQKEEEKAALNYEEEKIKKENKEKLERIIETKTREIDEWKKKIDMSDETISEVQLQIDSFWEQLPRLKKWIQKS